MQAADILTKPVTNAEKWRLAVSLLAHVNVANITGQKSPRSRSKSPQPQALALERSSGKPDAGQPQCAKLQRLMIEVCADPSSKLSDPSRKSSNGCRAIQFTEKHNLLDEKYRDYVCEEVNCFPMNKKVIVWVSLPCTGGFPGHTSI